MTSDPAQQPRGAGEGLTARLLAIMVAIGPPAAVSGWLWPKIQQNMLISVGVLLAYWVLVVAGRFSLRVGKAVSDLWVPRLAIGVDRRISAVISRHRSHYVRLLLSNVRDVELLGMATQGEYSLPLRDVYVDVSLAPSALQSTTREPFVGTELQVGERKTLESFLRAGSPRVYAVIGGPGSGKTTLLRRTAMALGEGRRRKRSLPLVLYLRDHVQEIVQNPDVTVAELLAGVTWLKGVIPSDWFERNLSRGRCVVMLDGLDEVAAEEHRQLTSAWVRDQVTRYPGNSFVLTSRPHGYNANPLTGADVLQVRRFTSEQIFRFVHNWYHAIERRSTDENTDRTRRIARDHADDLLLRMRRQPALYDLAANPMLLTMIANVHKYRGALPGSRAALYDEMCDLLLQRRQLAKNLPVGSGLKAEQRAKVVRELALAMMTKQVRDVTLPTANDIIGPTLARIPRNVSADEFLDELTKSGLFIERELGMYAFAHQTLQEYLAAVAIRDLPSADVLLTLVDNPWWRETILLWAANADASAVVEACLESGSVESLALAYDCAEEAREVDADLLVRLDALLYSGPPSGDPSDWDAHRKLLSAVRASRSLRHTVPLGNGAVICASPLPKSLYLLYTEWDSQVSQARPGAKVTAQNVERRVSLRNEDGEAVGVTAVDAEKLLMWVNSLLDDGTIYRLPTRHELADPMTAVVVDLNRRSIWYQDPSPDSALVRSAVSADEEDEAQLYTGPRLYVPDAVPHPYVATEDVHSQTVRRDLLTIGRVLPFVLSFCLERNPERARVHDYRAGLKRIEKLTLSKTPALEGKRNHIDRALARSRSGDMTQDRELIRLTDRATELADAVAELNIYPDDPGPVRDLTTMFRRTTHVSQAVGQALDIVLTRALQSEDIVMLARDLQDAEVRPGVGSQTSGRSAVPLPAEHDNASADFEIAVTALSLLLSLWQPGRNRYRPGQVLVEFSEYVVDLVRGSARVEPVIPEAASSVLRDVGRRLKTAQWADSAFEGSDETNDRFTWRVLARRIVAVVETRVAAVAELPPSVRISGPALRIALLAAAAVAERFAESDISAELRGVSSSLTCLEARLDDAASASEVILLIRT
ncbi:NACHT domain-containing protein [Kribbella sp. NPDC051770]|uniref:NACHT domain-containing protein n=1 Tax=Kribbella sp. NPDC051770 TaxID=3155413 RepID=UPI00342EB640